MTTATREIVVKQLAPPERVASKYIPAESTRAISDNDAQAIGEELERLYHIGKTTVDDVLESAAAPTSPFHKYIEWDDAKAAHEYRREQVRWVVRHINIIVSDEMGRLHEVRAFPAVRIPEGETSDSATTPRSFAPVTVVMGDPDKAAQVMRELEGMLRGFRTRLDSYAALFPSVVARYRPVLELIDSLESIKPS